MGRGFKQIIQESPLYFHLGLKFAGYKLFNKHSPFYGSADIINVCNLHCEHCYWWLNRKEEKDLTLEQWKIIIYEKFKKNHVFMVTLVGGEPLMRKDIVELFVKEFPKRACSICNDAYPIPYLKDIYFYWISIDGDKKTHNQIRGDNAWESTRKNVIDYVKSNGKKAWKAIWITMTINSKNYKTIENVIDDWKDYYSQIKPSNFCIIGFSNMVNDETGEQIKPLAPFRKFVKDAVFDDFIDYNSKNNKKLRGKEYWKSFWDTFEEYLRHPESKFDGDVGVLERKHVIVSEVRHIGKESDVLNEPFGLDEFSYEFYDDPERVDREFKENIDRILALEPKEVKDVSINRTTLWNVKEKIKNEEYDNITDKIKIKILSD